MGVREEAIVEREAARRLISIEDLLDALRWSHDLAEVADQLWVVPEVLMTRLMHLHPSERAYLRTRLAACNDGPSEREDSP